ncbi:MAG: thioredoxin family protein [Bacteriovoracaceae bacterium]|nr:thioredoxin family protein [Bacteriovoracaceae bacterium]
MLKRVFQLILTLGFFFSWATFANNEVPKDAVLMAAHTFTDGNDSFLALSYKNHKKWHTYWKNPGDAGLPIKFSFKSDSKEVQLEELEWPTPKRYIEQGNMWAYGYGESYSIFFKLSPDQLKSFNNKIFQIHSTWLVCKHICVPGQYKVEGNFKDSGFVASNNQLDVNSTDLIKRKNLLPKEIPFPSNLDLVLAKDPTKDALVLYYNLSSTAGKNPLSQVNLLTPFPVSPFTFVHEELFRDKKGNIFARFPIDWDGEYTEPEIPFPSSGKFKSPYELKFIFADPLTKSIGVIKKSFSSFNLTVGKSSNDFLKMLTPLSISKPSDDKKKEKVETPTTAPNKSSETSLLYYLLFAFLGGLILNIMPCVLPVISLKLFGLVQHASESNKRIFKHNMIYSLGVMFSFLVLALSVFAFKAAGETVGWGFQLQSPLFVALMIIVLFAMALNLFGLYEFRTPGGSSLGGVDIKDGFFGDFFSGVLATILSTPCSAPFLGTALTFAFTSSNTTILGVFMMIGLGLASPFILTAFFPSLIKFLPKPGMWMEHVKKFLGLTLLLTMVWLLDVYISLISGTTPFLILATIITLVFFALYFRAKISKSLFWNTIFFAMPVLLFINLATSPLQTDSGGESELLADKQRDGVLWEKFSQEKLDEYKSQGEVVFLDFTAKWCFTCKVNEKVVLDTKSFRDLVKSKNIRLLLGDWTKRDKTIGTWLKAHGMVGVPAYFVQKRDGTLVNLGETVSIKEIEKHL